MYANPAVHINIFSAFLYFQWKVLESSSASLVLFPTKCQVQCNFFSILITIFFSAELINIFPLNFQLGARELMKQLQPILRYLFDTIIMRNNDSFHHNS